jgi:hypothetical protein
MRVLAHCRIPMPLCTVGNKDTEYAEQQLGMRIGKKVARACLAQMREKPTYHEHSFSSDLKGQ